MFMGKYHGLVGANAECCCTVEQTTVIFVGLLWAATVCRVCHFVFLSPGAAARRLHSFFEYSVCVSLL